MTLLELPAVYNKSPVAQIAATVPKKLLVKTKFMVLHRLFVERVVKPDTGSCGGGDKGETLDTGIHL